MSRKLALAIGVLSSSPVLAGPPGDLSDPPPSSTTTEVCTERITEMAQDANLGPSTGHMHVVSPAFCWQTFRYGHVHSGTASTSKTIAITGGPLARYNELGSEAILGQAFEEMIDGSVKALRFAQGHIVAHPSYGTHWIQGALSSLWFDNARTLRFGSPTSEQVANPLVPGAYSPLQWGYVARTDGLGTWIDYTGTGGEGRGGATVDLFADAGQSGTTLRQLFSGESPIALNLGALDNQVSSLNVTMPTRVSLYLYDASPLDGRYVRITGADNAKIRVGNIGTFMNDRTSSIMLVNHGTASARSTPDVLNLAITQGLDALDLQGLLDDALVDDENNARGTIDWDPNSDVEVALVPGRRLITFKRRATLEISADCYGFTCHANGPVDFEVAVRPYVTMVPDGASPGGLRPTVHVSFVEGTATSVTCAGDGCGARETKLATLFESPDTDFLIEDTFDDKLDDLTKMWTDPMKGIGIRRVNVLPDAVEFVLADDASHAVDASGLFGVSTTRPVGSVTYGDTHGGAVPAFDGSITVVPNLLPPPPPPPPLK